MWSCLLSPPHPLAAAEIPPGWKPSPTSSKEQPGPAAPQRHPQPFNHPQWQFKRPPCVTDLGGDIQVHEEVLVGQGPEEQVEVAPCEPQGLCPCPGQLQVAAGWVGASDPVDGSLQPRVLWKAGKDGVWVSTAHPWPVPPVPGISVPITVRAATSPSLAERFHSSTRKCLKMFR